MQPSIAISYNLKYQTLSRLHRGSKLNAKFTGDPGTCQVEVGDLGAPPVKSVLKRLDSDTHIEATD